MAVIARLMRFALGALIPPPQPVPRRFYGERTILLLLAGFWIMFYAWYFAATGNFPLPLPERVACVVRRVRGTPTPHRSRPAGSTTFSRKGRRKN